MTGTADPVPGPVALSHLPPTEKAVRAASFGGVADHYERFRPGPPVAAVDWLFPEPVDRVVDLGAGTGALTRMLVDRSREVVAVEPDERMRLVLETEVPAARALYGQGEAIPLPDGSADAVVASSSWHWMDPEPTLAEVARVLRPGGFLAALWSGVDPNGPFVAQARALLSGDGRPRADGPGGAVDEDLSGLVTGDGSRPSSVLEIPTGVAFSPPERHVLTWDVALNADELIGLLGTFSWIITMAEDRRQHVLDEARRLLREPLGVHGAVTVDVGFRCETFRTLPTA